MLSAEAKTFNPQSKTDHCLLLLGGGDPDGILRNSIASDAYTLQGDRTKFHYPNCPEMCHIGTSGMTARAVMVGQTLYILGCGRLGTKMYKLETLGQWTKCAEIKMEAQKAYSVAATEYHIVCIFEGSVQVYDCATDTWRSGPSLPRYLTDGAAVGYNGTIIHSGGQTTDGKNKNGDSSNLVFRLTWATADSSCASHISQTGSLKRRVGHLRGGMTLDTI